MLAIFIFGAFYGCTKKSTENNASTNNTNTVKSDTTGSTATDEPPYDYLVLVNKENKLPQGW